MFTGLIEGTGQISRVTPQGPDAVLVISPPWDLKDCVLGESVAINGACLTVTKIGGQGFSVDVSAESLSRTTLGRLRPGGLVNLERAMQLGERLGGHMVSGHIDCVGSIAGISKRGASTVLRVAMPPEHLKYVVEKGSVAIDGISLTVNDLHADGFDLNIIPHTMKETTLQVAVEGLSVNIETDLIAKYVARLLGREKSEKGGGSGLSTEDLIRAGF